MLFKVGYFRALYGIQNAINMDDLTRHLDKELRWVLKQHSSRLHLSISDSVFASKLGKRARELLATHEASFFNYNEHYVPSNNNYI